MPWVAAAVEAPLVALVLVASNLALRRASAARLTLVRFLHLHMFDDTLTSLTEIDGLTDKAGLGDKYDSKIDKVADGQINNQVPGGAGSK